MYLFSVLLPACAAIIGHLLLQTRAFTLPAFTVPQPRQVYGTPNSNASGCPLSCPYYNLNDTVPWFLYLEIDNCGTPGTFDAHYTNCNYEAPDQGDSSYYYWCYYDPNNGGLLSYDSQPQGYGVDGSNTDCPEYLIQNCTGYTGGAPVSCTLDELQCCDTLALASEPAISNTLGLQGIPLPGADVTVGLGCVNLDVTTPPTPVTASCIGILSCCSTIGLGTNGTIAENCLMAGI